MAGQTDPITLSAPSDLDGDIDSPGVRMIAEMPGGYVEEEHFVAGTADIYNYTSHPGTPGSTTVVTAGDPYKTRIIVRRPANSIDFNGTVVIEWWNSTATFDTAPSWDSSAEYFIREGIVYVGVTNATSSIDFLVGECVRFGILPAACGTRYATLSMTDNGQAYDMVSQIAHQLKTNGAGTPLPVGFTVQRVFHTGQSQQGGSMIAYATNFHFASNDGYFIQAASNARRINDDISCDDGAAPAYPNCRAELAGTDRQVRTDLSVPVYRAMTETDVGGVLSSGTRQSDSGKFRYYEMAGTAHVTVHKDVELLPAGLIGPNPVMLEGLCQHPLNTLADGPVFGSVFHNAMWQNMADEVMFSTPSPAGVIIDSTGPDIDRDSYGNALGGLRVPQMDFPIATYGPHNALDPGQPAFLEPLGNLFCVLAGTAIDFPLIDVYNLYPSFDDFYNDID